MTMPEVVEFITEYAKVIAAPVQSGTMVTSVRRTILVGILLEPTMANGGVKTVVLAAGAFNAPR